MVIRDSDFSVDSNLNQELNHGKTGKPGETQKQNGKERKPLLMAFRRTNSSVYPNPGGAVIDVTFEPNTVTNINK